MVDKLCLQKVPDNIIQSITKLSINEHSNELEQVLVGKLSIWNPKDGDGSIFEYLIQSYNRLTKYPKSPVSEEVKYLLLSYMGLILTIPSMFPQLEVTIELGPKVLIPFLIDNEITTELLVDFINRFKDETEQFAEIFEPILAGLCEAIRKEGLLGNFNPILDVLQFLLTQEDIRSMLVTGSGWKPDCGANNMGNSSVLGSFLTIGVDVEDMVALYELLPNRDPLYTSQVECAYYSMRTALHLLHTRLHSIFYSFIKISPINKEAILDWFAYLAHLNVNRLKIQVDPLTVSSDRLMSNAFFVLLKFCEPFLSPSSPKLTSVDPLYYIKSQRINVLEATKNNATTTDYEEFLSTNVNPIEKYNANFISEVFFLTLQYFRLSIIRMISFYMELHRKLREGQEAIESFESTHNNNNNASDLRSQMAIKNAKAQILKMKDMKLCLDVWLLDDQNMEHCFTLVTVLSTWLHSLIISNDENIFKMLPEFLVECIGEYLLFISRFNPQFWLKNNRDLSPVINFIMTILDQVKLVKNPYLRCKFVDFLYSFTDPHLEYFFDIYPSLVDKIAVKLMHLYIEVESTGASSQFYDKFNIRYNISKILQTLWNHPSHRANIIKASKDDDLFIRFTNLLLNDTTFLLDESISKLSEIHERQLDSATVDAEQQRTLQTLERQCQSYIQLANSTLDMLVYLSSEIIDPFLRPELIDRLAAMLALNILHLTGPKCRNLKVRNPEKYFWEPKLTLKMLVSILLNMGRRGIFLKAVARDTRSFSVDTFNAAAGILKRHCILPSLDIDRFERVTKKIAEYVVAAADESAELGEVPEEFLDPLMFTIMEDPVLLETSKVIVDRSTIVAHLLNDQTDPFNRMPLTMQQVTPQTDLQKMIKEFKTSRLK